MHAETPLLLFAIATIAGGAFATIDTGPRPLPLGLAAVQELMSMIAFAVLFVAVVSTSQPPTLLVVALGLFASAAAGASALLPFHVRRRPLPPSLTYLHAIGTSSGYACVAVCAFVS